MMLSNWVSVAMAVSMAHAAAFPEYPIRLAADYPISLAKSGVTIAIEPLDDGKTQKTYFKTELRSKGFLPVFVVLHNQSNSDSFVLKREDVGYSDGSAFGATSPNARSKTGEAVGVASVAAISLAGAFVAMKLITKATEVQQNLLKKELRSQT